MQMLPPPNHDLTSALRNVLDLKDFASTLPEADEGPPTDRCPPSSCKGEVLWPPTEAPTTLRSAGSVIPPRRNGELIQAWRAELVHPRRVTIKSTIIVVEQCPADSNSVVVYVPGVGPQHLQGSLTEWEAVL